MNSNVFEGNDPRNLVLPREGNTFHADHGNEKAAEIIAVLVKFLSYSDSSRINMNSHLNDREIFLTKHSEYCWTMAYLLMSNMRCTATAHYLLSMRIQYHRSEAALTGYDVATSVEIQSTAAHFPEPRRTSLRPFQSFLDITWQYPMARLASQFSTM